MAATARIVQLDEHTTLLLDSSGSLLGIMSDQDLLQSHTLLKRVRKCISDSLRETHVERGPGRDGQFAARIATLTDREHQVMDMLVEAKHTKAIAHELGITSKTVDHHRAKILKKMGVESVVELVRLMLGA